MSSDSSCSSASEPPSSAAVNTPTLVVGIVVSAASDSIRALLSALPEKTGAAFFLIQETETEVDALTAEHLGTLNTLTIHELNAEMEVELAADCAYLLPPKLSGNFVSGRFRPSPSSSDNPPADTLLSSLAADALERSVAIILSGTGASGIYGIKAIKERGGLVLVEDPEAAQEPEKPSSAASTGLVDEILQVPELARRFANFADQSRLAQQSSLSANPMQGTNLDEIISTLHACTGYDFSEYKKPTLSRRIQRRMGLRNVADVPGYISLLNEDPEESFHLFKDMLIGVTAFFRDQEAFNELRRRVLAPLIANRQSPSPLRIWMPGCSTGEEAYSLSIMLHEEFARQGVPYSVQIFATDIDENAVAKARSGRYNSSVVHELPEAFLHAYFDREDNGYRVKKILRESVTFAIQNVIADPPFSKLDLICCRNLLIYLETSMQNKLLELFHFSLNDSGYLFLGSSESTARHETLYAPVSKQNRIFRKKPVQGHHPSEHRSYSFSKSSTHLNKTGLSMDPHNTFFSAAETTRTTLLNNLAPSAVLINSSYEILYFHGETSQYLYRLEGEPTNDLCAIAASGLKTKIRAAVQQARKSGTPSIARARHVRKMDDSRVAVTVSALPVRKTREGESLFVVSFTDETASDQVLGEAQAEDKNTSLYSQLEYELLVTRQDLQSTIEQLETSNEELKASNEEIMSMNEELQSSNEELETSREELQSLNEELNTVNNQLEDKVQELEALNNDLSNLLSSTDIATIFLDTQLRIRRFTPAAHKIVHLINSDIGRPLADLALNSRDRNLIDDCRRVMETLQSSETQVSDERENVYLRRITLYRTSSDRIGGVVITFTDITEINNAINQLAARERQQALVARFGQEALAEDDLEQLFDRAAKWTTEAIGVEFCKVLELQGEQLLLRGGIGWRDGLLGQAFQSAELSSQGGYTLASGKPVIVEDIAAETRFPSPIMLAQHNVRSGMSVIIGPYSNPWGVLGVHSRSPRRFTLEDINFIQAIANGLWSAIQRKQSLQEVTTNAMQLQMAMHLGQMGSWTWDLEANTAVWDQATAEIFGLPAAMPQSTIDDIFERIHPDDLEVVHQDMARLIADDRGFRREYRIIHGETGQLRWLAGYGGVRREGPEQRPIIYGLGYDITDRKHYEVALLDREEWLRLALTSAELTSFWIDLAADELSLYNPTLGRYLEAEPYSLSEYLERVEENDRNCLEQVWRNALEHQTSFVIEYRMTQNKVTRWFRNWGNYVALQGRSRLAGITMDITHEKENEQRLKAAKQAADASSQAKSAFLANMSHEIRTPLTAILGYADLLHMELEDRNLTDGYLHKIKANGQNLLEIIDDVLDLSKVEADRIEVKRDRFALKTLLSELLSLTHLRARQKELDFFIEIAEPVPACISSDLVRLKQVLSNVISNAIKFTHQGSVTLEISAENDNGRQNTTMVFRVIDTGIGIDSAFLGKIFEPFEQADSSIAKTYGGTGLGLTISKRITQLLGGSLEAQSSLGEGSVFTLRLPVGSTESENYRHFEGMESLIQESPQPSVDGNELRGIHVLVVDDIDDVLALIQQMLKRAGASVSTASNGKEALERIETLEAEGPGVDIVLMDTMMPLIDGYTAVRRLRQQGFSKPIVALTAAAMTNDRERCLEAGCNDYLSKPVTLEQLIAVLQAQLPPQEFIAVERSQKVLIVEDNLDVGEAVKGLLELLGYQCRHVSLAKDAFEEAGRFNPHIILVDLNLPDMDGKQLAALLRQQSSSTLIALSGHDLEAQDQQLKAVGFDAYLQKPVDMAALSRYFPPLAEPEKS